MSKGLLVDVPTVMKEQYAEWLKLVDSELKSLQDPSVAPGEVIDILESYDVAPLVRAIQARISGSPSLAEAAMLHGFRGLDSLKHETDIRLMTRDQYISDSALEKTALINKIQYDLDSDVTILLARDPTQV